MNICVNSLLPIEHIAISRNTICRRGELYDEDAALLLSSVENGDRIVLICYAILRYNDDTGHRVEISFELFGGKRSRAHQI